MNSKLGTIVTTVLMLAGVMFWSASILADEGMTANGNDQPLAETRTQAQNAHREAVVAAVARMRESTRLDLDIELVGRTSVQLAGD